MISKNKFFLLLDYAIKIGKERGFGKGRFFFLKSLVFPEAAVTWIKFCDNFFTNLSYSEAPWYIVSTPLRLCLSNHFSAKQRCQILQSNCEILEQNFSRDFLKEFFKDKEFSLSTIAGKNDSEYEFRLSYNPTWRREGFLTILFYDNKIVIEEKDQKNKKAEPLAEDEEKRKGLALATISFTIFKNNEGKISILIGGLQGVRSMGDEGKSLVVKSTRNLHGLRPKFAVLSCAYFFSSHFNVSEIIATSIANHPIRLTNKRRKREFYADYDNFWLENGGTLRKDGNFNLPLIQPKRTLEEVPAKKRKDWLARQEYLEVIKQNTKDSIKSYKRN